EASAAWEERKASAAWEEREASAAWEEREASAERKRGNIASRPPIEVPMPKRVAVLIAGLVCFSAVQPPPGPTDALYQAIRKNDLVRWKAVVRTAADANRKSEAGDPPLMVAAAVGSIEAMRFLLDTGADVNGTNAFGATALIWSATEIAKVRLLLER